MKFNESQRKYLMFVSFVCFVCAIEQIDDDSKWLALALFVLGSASTLAVLSGNPEKEQAKMKGSKEEP